LRSVLYIKDDPKTCVRFSIPCYRPNLFYDVVQDNTNGVSVPHLKKFIDEYLTEENLSLGVSILFLQYIRFNTNTLSFSQTQKDLLD